MELNKEQTQEKKEETFEDIDKIKNKKPDMIQEGKTKLIVPQKTIKCDATDLYMARVLTNLDKILIDLKSAKDSNDLFRKNIEFIEQLILMFQTPFQQELLKSLRQSIQNNKTLKTEENKEIIA